MFCTVRGERNRSIFYIEILNGIVFEKWGASGLFLPFLNIFK
jgi:hypothetical protein